MQLFGAEPSGVEVFGELWRALSDMAQVAVHGEVKGGIVILRGAKQASYPNLHAELLAYLAHQRLVMTLVRFYLASGELPKALPIPVATLSGKVLAFVMDDSSNDFDVFHRESILFVIVICNRSFAIPYQLLTFDEDGGIICMLLDALCADERIYVDVS